MVLGTVSATNAASQQLRLDYITTKPLSSFSAFKDVALLLDCTPTRYHAFGLESAASAGLPGVPSAGGQAVVPSPTPLWTSGWGPTAALVSKA